MKRNTAVVSISLPPDILSMLESWAKSERKTKTALIKEALQWYKAWKFKRDWQELRKMGEEIRQNCNFQTEADLYKYLESD